MHGPPKKYPYFYDSLQNPGKAICHRVIEGRIEGFVLRCSMFHMSFSSRRSGSSENRDLFHSILMKGPGTLH